MTNSQWLEFLTGRTEGIDAALPRFLRTRRWFAGKARTLRAVEVVDAVPIGVAPEQACIALVRAIYRSGPTEVYVVPLALANGVEGVRVLREERADIVVSGREGVAYDALAYPPVLQVLLDTIKHSRSLSGGHGVLAGQATGALKCIAGAGRPPRDAVRLAGEQSNTSIVYSRRLILKIFRRPEVGVNPDLEVSRFLTDRGYPNIPPVAGSMEYLPRRGGAMSVAILQAFIRSRGDAWRYALDLLRVYFSRVAHRKPPAGGITASTSMLLTLAGRAPRPPAPVLKRAMDAAALLGRRTAELHLVLSSDESDPDFAPEPLTAADRRRVAGDLRREVARVLKMLRTRRAADSRAADAITEVLGREEEIVRRVERFSRQPIAIQKIRGHGDFHLGQVLYTGDDFVIIDFEGEPDRPLSERRRKHPAIRDVAGMLRSLHYAAHAGMLEFVRSLPGRRIAVAGLAPWADFWYQWTAVAFLHAYAAAGRRGRFFPAAKADFETLLDIYLLDKTMYEVGYELNHRPAWVTIPVEGILHLVSTDHGGRQ